MKIKIYFCVLYLILSTTTVWSGKLPGLMLEKGTNNIALSFVNKWDDDLSDIVIEINNKELPNWLNIQTVVREIDISKGLKGQEKLILIINVFNAPYNASYELPFIVKNNQGNQWDYSLPVKVISSITAYDVLYENYPNPFNPSTTIKYGLKENRHTKLVIYNSLGQKVRTLIDQPQTAGMHVVHWDGENDSGLSVSSGLYIYRLISGQFVQTRRMMLLD